MLHNDRETFEQLILRTSEDSGIDASIVEKDYYVTLLLQRIVERLPDIIFKGGTSLSKCYRLIRRFSEDIDLNIDTQSHPTEGQRKKLKEVIVSAIDGLGFHLTNPEDVRSRRDYNRYIVGYPAVFASGYLKEHLIVETAVYIKAYPCKKMYASSLVWDYLQKNGYRELIEEYQLQPFALNVQTAERTLVDKVYALGDYYLSGAVHEHSRHLYDIYKLLEVVRLDNAMKRLVQEVRWERAPHINCRSAKSGVNMTALLQEILGQEVYRQDYEEVTSRLLFEEVSYDAAAKALQEIADSCIFGTDLS